MPLPLDAVAFPTVPRPYSQHYPCGPYAGPSTFAWIAENFREDEAVFRANRDMVCLIKTCRPDQYTEGLMALGYMSIDEEVYHLEKCLQDDRIFACKVWKTYDRYHAMQRMRLEMLSK